MTATWRVGAILNETLAETLRFAGWYLELGASGLTLLFDNPRDPAIGILGTHPRITCVPCTPEFWLALGLPPETRFPKRQNAGLSWVYRDCTEDWLLNVDSDEFLYPAGGTVSGLLDAQPDDTDFLRIAPAEAVAPAEPQEMSVFRMPMTREAAIQVYGESRRLFGPRRMGLVGHCEGKSFTRSGLEGVTLRQHWPQRARGPALNERRLGRNDGVYLLHCIGLDYETWYRKLDWRSNSRGFTGPLTERIRAAMNDLEAERLLSALHAELHVMSPGRLDRLRAASACLELELDLDGPALRAFGDAFAGLPAGA